MNNARIENPIAYHKGMEVCRFKCKCGHTITITKLQDKNLCDFCGHYVFKSEEDEKAYQEKVNRNRFKYKMNQLLKEKK